MNFEQSYEEFIHRHLSGRSGERKGRLERGHRYAEALFLRNVWWPFRGDFSDLHPEYEVLDWRVRSSLYSRLKGILRMLKIWTDKGTVMN